MLDSARPCDWHTVHACSYPQARHVKPGVQAVKLPLSVSLWAIGLQAFRASRECVGPLKDVGHRTAKGRKP